jgi:hypothetical protein
MRSPLFCEHGDLYCGTSYQEDNALKYYIARKLNSSHFLEQEKQKEKGILYSGKL